MGRIRAAGIFAQLAGRRELPPAMQLHLKIPMIRNGRSFAFLVEASGTSVTSKPDL